MIIIVSLIFFFRRFFAKNVLFVENNHDFIYILQCEVHQLSGAYVWAQYYLDVSDCKKETIFAPSADQKEYGLRCKCANQNVNEILPANWIDEFVLPRLVRHSVACSYYSYRSFISWRNSGSSVITKKQKQKQNPRLVTRNSFLERRRWGRRRHRIS